MISHLGFLWSGVKCGSAVVIGQLIFYATVSALEAEQEDVVAMKDISYGKGEKQKLDIYLPASAVKRKRCPIFVFFHGGGWSAGSKDNYERFANLIAQRGYVVVVPNYRLYPSIRFPTFVEDSARAIQWVQENLSAMGGDVTRIVLSGHSAGAHISSLLVFDSHYFDELEVESESIRGLVGIAGPYAVQPSRVPPITDIFAGAEDRVTMPVTFVDAPQPPVLLLHGAKDWLVPTDQSSKLKEKLAENDSDVELAIFDEYKHIDIMPGFRAAQQDDGVLEKIIAFLKRVTEI